MSEFPPDLLSRLTADERGRLVLEALDRGDSTLVAQVQAAGIPSVLALRDHSPFVMALTELALTIRIERLDLAGQLSDLVAVGSHPDASTECLQTAARLVRDKSMAWERFCQRIGVPPTVAVAMLPGGERLEHADRLAAHLLGPIPPDPTIARALDEALRNLWRSSCDRWQVHPSPPSPVCI